MAADHKSLIQNFQRDIDTGRPSILDTYIGPAYVDHNPPPIASKKPGMAGLKETFNTGLDIFSEFSHVVDDQVSEGDKVATRITGTGKHVGAFLGIPPTNKMVTMSGIAIHRIADGKLVEHWGQVDAMALLVQMGAVPAPPALPTLPKPQIARDASAVVLGKDQMKQALRRLFEEGINRRNRGVLDELVHPAYVNYSMPMAEPGPRGLNDVVDMFFRAFPDMHVTVDDIIAEDDKAATRGHMTGTQHGTFMNVPPTGKPIAIEYIDIWKAHDGRFVENWVQMDILGALVQIGAVPAPQV
jgi:predicted ester cyclase